MRTLNHSLLRFCLFVGITVLAPQALSVSDAFGQDSQANSSAQGSSSNADPSYKAVGIRTGTWNDGKAALWDIALTDQFFWFGPGERRDGYRPEQPIHFSHVLHVQKNKMDCQYCHWSVSKAAYAAIPETETCMGCHKLVAGVTEQGKKDIEYLKEMYEAGKPIPWRKVHVTPDHVKFNHKRHVKAGISCASCHGQVPEMEVVERVSSMKMGWCITCHREKGASIDCVTCHR